MSQMASVCYLVMATWAAHCADPMPFDEARREVERRVVVQSQFFDPKYDPHYYFLRPADPAATARLMRPVKPEPQRLAEKAPEPLPHGRYERNRRGVTRKGAPVLRGTMRPIP